MIEITIRSLQHYIYCPHRWGLMEIDRAWAENYFVTRGNLRHKRVHEKEKYSIRDKKVFTGVNVYNDKYGLYGVVDCIEGESSKKGVDVLGDDNKYELRIVEYIPSKPKDKDYNFDDLMQVFAQKVCVDYVFDTDCEGIIYYAKEKKRVLLPLKENYYEYEKELVKILEEMRENIKEGTIPPIMKKQKCRGCSMKDICMPKLKKIKCVKDEISKTLGE